MKKEKLFVMILAVVLLFGGAYKLYDELTVQHAPESTAGNEQKVLAMDFTVYDKEGNEVNLSDYIGKPIVMNFWASWCTPCQIEMPEFQKKYEEHGEDVHFLMVNMTASGGETVKRAHAFVENGGYTFPVVFDTEYDAADTYRANAYPTTFFIDENGYIVNRVVGVLDAETLQQGIDMIV